MFPVFSKYNGFLWVYRFLAKNIAFLDPPSLRFHNQTDTNGYWISHHLFRIKRSPIFIWWQYIARPLTHPSVLAVDLLMHRNIFRVVFNCGSQNSVGHKPMGGWLLQLATSWPKKCFDHKDYRDWKLRGTCRENLYGQNICSVRCFIKRLFSL